MMISSKMEKALNKQIAMEAEASFIYLAMASWCDSEGLEGGAAFYYGHSTEEHDHMMRFFDYVNEVGGKAVVPGIKQPDQKYKSITEVCEKAYDHEKKVTAAIHELVTLASKENDYTTREFLQFFVDEQKEEEVLFTRVLDRIKLIGKGGQSLYYIDKELGKFAVEDASEEKA